MVRMQLAGFHGSRPLQLACMLLALAAVTTSSADARRRCIFLECGPANTPNPNPPKAPDVPNIRPSQPPQHEGLQRTRLQGETCDDVGGFRYCVSSVLDPQFGFSYNPRNLVDTDLKTAWVEGKEVSGEDRAKLLAKGKAHWINDSFWLNPVSKLRDEGVALSTVAVDDGAGLMATYGSGGNTPGDSYLWIVDDKGLPTAWKMWTKIIPIGGLKASWESWVTLDSGAKVSTQHVFGPLTLALTEVSGAATLDKVEPGPDPFAPLFEQAKAAGAPASRPASRPVEEPKK